MARSNIPLDFTTPDFARVREESGVFTEEAMRSLYVLSVDSRRRLLGIEQMFGWQDVAFAAGNFTANSGTWTVASGDQQLYRYTKIGRVLSLNFFLEDTTTGSCKVRLKTKTILRTLTPSRKHRHRPTRKPAVRKKKQPGNARHQIARTVLPAGKKRNWNVFRNK